MPLLIQFLIVIIISSLCTECSQQKATKLLSNNALSTALNKINTNTNQAKQSENTQEKKGLISEGKLTVIGYASDRGPAQHLISFASQYDLDLHLIGLDEEWGGFNDKISGFHSFIASLPNRDNNSFILILDAYDTVPICGASDLLSKFSTFNSDIVMSTGKDCWPDPNVSSFLLSSINESYPYFPWFLCPNAGAIMGRHSAMLNMLSRVQELVSFGNGSCSDFEGNTFTRNTQSDQRCYTTYFVELIVNNTHDISLKLDHSNELFMSLAGMMFIDIDIDSGVFRSKITNGSSCILHGNGPGVILFRSFIKQMMNNGNLYIDDYVLRIGVDFFHWMLWWLVMPAQRLSHWLSIHHHFDIGFHSTTFSEQVIWRFHVGTFCVAVIITALSLWIWYKYRFIKYKNIKYIKSKKKQHHINYKSSITKQLVKGLANLEIVVHHNGNTFPLLKTRKNS